MLVGMFLSVAVFRGDSHPKGFNLPAATAPQAQRWTGEQNDLPEEGNSLDRIQAEPSNEFPGNLRDRYDWPADFDLPLDVVIEDLPGVPEKIDRPSPPFDQPRPSEPSKKWTWPFG